MPVCVYCKQTLHCPNCKEPQPIGQTAIGCPSKVPAKLWIHVIDDLGNNIPNVPTIGPSGQDTNSAGLATFDNLSPDDYTAQLKLPLPSKIAERFDAPEDEKGRKRTMYIESGTLAHVPFMLTRKAELKVSFVLKSGTNPLTPFVSVPVEVKAVRSGPGSALSKDPVKTTGGTADFGLVSAGKYELTPNYAGVDASEYEFSGDPFPVTLSPGPNEPVVFELTRKAKVNVEILFKRKSTSDQKVYFTDKDIPVKASLQGSSPKEVTVGTGTTGIAAFSLAPGSYTFTPDYTGVDKALFEVDDSPRPADTLESGDNEPIVFEVIRRKPQLKVKIVLKPDPTVTNPPEVLFKDLPVKITVNTGTPQEVKTGEHDFGHMKADKYKLTAAFSDPDQIRFDFPEPTESDQKPTEKEIELEKDEVVVFQVEPLYTKVRFIAHCLAAIPKQIYAGPTDWQLPYLKQVGYDEAQLIPDNERKDIARDIMSQDDFDLPKGNLRNWKARYVGLTQAPADINARVAFIGSCIKKAAEQFDPKDDELKVYVIPECFFLGKRGAYELEHFETLIEKLQELVQGPAWRHWLFSFGTVNFAVPPPTSPQGAIAQSGPIECQNVSPVIRGGSRSKEKSPAYTRIIRKGFFSQEMPKDVDLENRRVNLNNATTIAEWDAAVRAELTSEAVGFGFGATENEHVVGRAIGELVADVEPTIQSQSITLTCQNNTLGDWGQLKQQIKNDIAARGLILVVRDVRRDKIPNLDWALKLKKLLELYMPECEHVQGRLIFELITDFEPGPRIGNQSIKEVFVTSALTERNWEDLKSSVKARVLKDGLIPTLRVIRSAQIPSTASTLADCHLLGENVAFKKLLAMYGEPQKSPVDLLTLLKASFVFEESYFWCKRRPGALLDRTHGDPPVGKRISFGLEICADHGEGRLATATSEGSTPEVDVQLVPSAGMSITPLAVAARENGFVFNCDGWNYLSARSDSARIGKFKMVYDDNFPKDPGHNPLYPHSRLVKVTAVKPVKKTAEIALVKKEVALTDDASSIFGYGAGELHVYEAKDLPK